LFLHLLILKEKKEKIFTEFTIADQLVSDLRTYLFPSFIIYIATQ